MLREFELQQAWSNYWYLRPSRKSFDTAQMPFGCTGFGFQQSKQSRQDGPAAGLGWCPTSHCQGCAEQFGRTEPFGKYIMGPWEIVAGSPANCSLSGRTWRWRRCLDEDSDELQQVAVKAAQEPFYQSGYHLLAEMLKKGSGLIVVPSRHVFFNRDRIWQCLPLDDCFLAIYFYLWFLSEKTVKLKNGNPLVYTLQKTSMAIENHHA